MSRKETSLFYFSVEGQCEHLYLSHLNKIINNSTRYYDVDFDIKVTPNPESAIKKFTYLNNSKVFHVIDYEENNQTNQKKFELTLQRMKRAEKIKGKNQYVLAYSNISFELWIILHKTLCLKSCSTTQDYLKIINKNFGTRFKTLGEYKEEKNFKKLLENITLEDILSAIEHSKKIMKNCKQLYTPHNLYGYEYYEENPSLSIGYCIEKILLECKVKGA